MKHAGKASILALSLAAIGCAAQPAASTEETVESDVVSPPAQTARPAPEDGPTDDTPAAVTGMDVPAFEALLHGGAPVVTSTVKDAAGATYVTGTFTGWITVGDAKLKSRGDRDVFLTKMAPSGALLWVRAVGSLRDETAPRVDVDDATGRVTVVGMTTGEMDCGDGALPHWEVETFFLCVFGWSDGTSLASGVFPTGRTRELSTASRSAALQ